MRIIRFINHESKPTLGALTDQGQLYDLPQKDFLVLVEEAEESNQSVLGYVKKMISEAKPLGLELADLELLVPIEAPEVWASGVTYKDSRDARNYEATGGKLDAKTFYDKVYHADRPEIFLKSTSLRTVGPNKDLYLRSDSNWQIPEPELGVVINKVGKILGFTAGNDMSCRDIEGENPLYLPQAKIWKRSCSIGPAIRLADSVLNPYDFEIKCRIYRNGEKVSEGSANTSQLNRKIDELVSFLVRDNEVFNGTVLLTGTCIVPPNKFTLADGDSIEIEISGIGILSNSVKQQKSKITQQ